MPLDRELIRRVRALDPFDLRRLTILVQGLMVARQQEAFEVGPPEPGKAKVTYRQEWVRCGRDNCSKCPHGPYWYAYWREDGRMRSRYIGKDLQE